MKPVIKTKVMKTADIKSLKGKVNGVKSTLVKVSDTDKSLGNILFVLGFKQANGYYYKEGDIDIVSSAKLYIKKGKYENSGEFNVDFTGTSYSSVDKVDDVDELNRLVNMIID